MSRNMAPEFWMSRVAATNMINNTLEKGVSEFSASENSEDELHLDQRCSSLESITSYSDTSMIGTAEISDRSTTEAISWQCSQCNFPMHPSHARICVKCVPLEAAENTATALIIRDYEKTETELVCAHCAIESAHRFHITKLYLPIKMKQVSQERHSELRNALFKTLGPAEEIKSINATLDVLAAKHSNLNSLEELSDAWRMTETVIQAISDANCAIEDHIKTIEKTTKEIEKERLQKQKMLSQLHSLTKLTGQQNRRRSKSLSPLDEDHSGPILKRFCGVADLTTVGAD